MNVTPFSLVLGGIITIACAADADETCCPCPRNQRTATCTRSSRQPTATAQATTPATEILAFGASWCGPCQKMAPVLADLEKQGLNIRRIDVDNDPAMTRKFRVTSLPTMVKLIRGREAGRLVGMTSADQVTSLAGKVAQVCGLAGKAKFAESNTDCPACCESDHCCADALCEIPAATEVETLLRATYEVPHDKAAALVGLLEKTTQVSMETKIADGKLTITTTPAAQRTIGAFINAFLRDSSVSPLSACSS
ncbi:Thioredoxin-like protein [Symmachiella dynata]|uniref:thioredoxin family protein n=1 Tax=Symmachiella dynata TaxID=2527995 RepID=UPI00118C7CF7|nr:thioredoxin family protein [Symmachiella dynata]QDT51983.1 Thioredoxin-like protein [Symmachiella dynata]